MAMSATAQPPRLGDRIRIHFNPPVDGRPIRLEGHFGRLTKDSVWYSARRAESPVPVSLAAVNFIEVAAGRRRHTGTGALIGMAVGGVAGLAIGVACGHCADGGDSFIDIDPAGVTVLLTTLGAVSGIIPGALVGHFVRSPRWRSGWAPLPSGHRSLGIGWSVPLPPFSAR